MARFTHLDAPMPNSRARSRTAPLTSNAYEDVIAAWNATINGGIIICRSPGKAINLRYRMYRYRGLLCEAHGATPFDDMTITIAKGDHRLIVQKRDSGILEIRPFDTPDAPTTIERPNIIIAPAHTPNRLPPTDTDRRNEGKQCRWCHSTIHDAREHGIGVCTHERSRPPLDFEPDPPQEQH